MKAIVIDYATSTISLSSAFAKKAMIPGTQEYAQLQEVRRDYPDFKQTIRQFKTNTKQDRYAGLTYDYMRWYIERVEGENAPEMLDTLERMIDISKCHSACKKYPTIKKWFLMQYPEISTFTAEEREIQRMSDFVERYEDYRAEMADALENNALQNRGA